MVRFLFLDTRVLGVPIPFHQDFAEVNLLSSGIGFCCQELCGHGVQRAADDGGSAWGGIGLSRKKPSEAPFERVSSIGGPGRSEERRVGKEC